MGLDFETEIEILLFDQEKIVTYKEVNNKFNITPKEAQCVLNDFINKRQKLNDKKKEFSIIYLLILNDKEKNAKKIVLSNENELNSYEQKYEIISKQIYSIQCKPINDFNLIYSNDVDTSNNTTRKSNLKLVYNTTNEPQQENLVEMKISKPDETAGGVESKAKKSSSNEMGNVLKPSNETNTNLNKDKEKSTATSKSVAAAAETKEKTAVKNEKEVAKETKVVKAEPMQVDDDEVEVAPKKAKVEEAKNVVTKASNQSAPAAAAASKPVIGKHTSKAGSKPAAANQSTLTSFFKKA